MRPLAPSALAAILLASATASAQSPPAPNDPALQAISKQFDEGKRLYREGKRLNDRALLERAYFDFAGAYAVYHGPGVLLNLVASERATGRDLDAMRHLRDFVSAYGVPDEHSEHHHTFQLSWNAVNAATGHVEVVEAPAALHILVDGKEEPGTTPLATPIDVPPGHHVLETSGPEKLRVEADVVAGSTVRVNFIPAPRPAPTPRLASPTAPMPDAPSPPAADQLSPSPATSFWTGRRLWGASVAGAGAVSLLVSGVFAVKSHDAATSAAGLRASNTTCGSSPSGGICTALNNAYNTQNSDATVSQVFLAAGLVAVVTGATLFLWPTSPTPSGARTAIDPFMMPHGGGFQLRGDL